MNLKIPLFLALSIAFFVTISLAMNSSSSKLAKNGVKLRKNGKEKEAERFEEKKEKNSTEEKKKISNKNKKETENENEKASKVSSSSVVSMSVDSVAYASTANIQPSDSKRKRAELESKVKEQEEQIRQLQQEMEQIMRELGQKTEEQPQQVQAVQQTERQQQQQTQAVPTSGRHGEQTKDEHQLQLHHIQPIVLPQRQQTGELLEILQQKMHKLPMPTAADERIERSAKSAAKGVEEVQQQAFEVGHFLSIKTPKTPRGNNVLSELRKTILEKLDNMRISLAENTEWVADETSSDKIEAMVRRTAMESIEVIYLATDGHGFKRRENAITKIHSKMNTNELFERIAWLENFPESTTNFVIDQLKAKISDGQIRQILDEIESECADFERHIEKHQIAKKWHQNNASRMIVKRTKFVLAFCRLYDKLLDLLRYSIGPERAEERAEDEQQKKQLNETEMNRSRDSAKAKELFSLVQKVSEEMTNKLRMLAAHDDLRNEAYKWRSALVCLEDRVKVAKLAILIAFPRAGLKEWVGRGGGWAALKRVLRRIDLDIFIAHSDQSKNRIWQEGITDQGDEIRKCISDAGKNGMMFSNLTVMRMQILLEQNISKVKRRAFYTKEIMALANLALFIGIFKTVIGFLESPTYDIIELEKVRGERENALRILEICLLLWDAKFDKFMDNAHEKIAEMDKIRKVSGI